MSIILVIIWLIITFPVSLSLMNIIFDELEGTKYYKWRNVIYYTLLVFINLTMLVIFHFLDNSQKAVIFPFIAFNGYLFVTSNELALVIKDITKEKMKEQNASRLKINLADLGVSLGVFLMCGVVFAGIAVYSTNILFSTPEKEFNLIKLLFQK